MMTGTFFSLQAVSAALMDAESMGQRTITLIALGEHVLNLGNLLLRIHLRVAGDKGVAIAFNGFLRGVINGEEEGVCSWWER